MLENLPEREAEVVRLYHLQVPELPPDRQAARHPRELGRPDPGQGPATPPPDRRAAWRTGRSQGPERPVHVGILCVGSLTAPLNTHSRDFVRSPGSQIGDSSSCVSGTQ